MAEWWINFHFLRPWWLLLLMVPLLWFGRYFRAGAGKSSWEKVVDERLLGYLLVKGSSGQRRIMAWLALLGIIGAIIATAGPSWVKIEIPALEAENPLMIALNLSSDMKETDLTPSRLERAKYKIKDLTEIIPGVQSGLMVYSAEPFVISPLSADGQIISNLLPAVNYNIMPSNGDRADRAIALAAEKLRDAGYQKGRILLIAPDAGQSFDQALEAARQALALGMSVDVLNASAQDNEKLQMIAEAGGGKYLRLSGDEADIRTLAAGLEKNTSQLKEGKNWQSVWLDYGYYLLALPLLCCLYFFRKGILVIALVLIWHPAEAGFFLNANQEGLKAFQAGDFAAAGANFETPEWKGASYYRQGNFEAAYKEFAKGQDVTALYNQGNALAKAGKIDEAIAKYEQVLEQEPEHEDAKFNLEYLKQQKEQQQQNQQNQQQNSDNQNNEQQQDNQSGGSGSDEQEQEQNQQPEQDQQNGDEQNQGNERQDSQAGENQSNGQADAQPDENDGQSQSGNSQNEPQLVGSEQSEQEAQDEAGGAALSQGDESQEYDEKVQARAQQYREIPEDPGGLLKAFIQKEYARNRYQD